MGRIKWVVAAALVVVAVGAGIRGSDRASATHPGDNGLILMSGSLVTPDGTSVRNWLPGHARFNAQGDRLYYGQWDYKTDTTTLRWLSNGGADEQFASRAGSVEMEGISTDGRQVVVTGFVSGEQRIYTVGTDGNGWREVGAHAVVHRYPDFKPNSQQIAYIQGYDVFRINSDGSGKTQWTDECTYTDGQEWWECGEDLDRVYTSPKWSPDGTKVLVFVEEYEPYPSTEARAYIGVLSVGSTVATPLVNIDIAGGFTVPTYAWSPDGTKIVYSKNGDVFTMPAGGGSSTTIPTAPTSSSPTGSRVRPRAPRGSPGPTPRWCWASPTSGRRSRAGCG